jgi:membrane fusion protein (multidrug efflux system)
MVISNLQCKLVNTIFRYYYVLAIALAAMSLESCQQQAAQGPPPPPEVGVSTVVAQDVTTYGDWVATLDGYVNAQIQPQVSGYLIRQDYREGSLVHKGDVLFEIDPRPFKAVLDQAEGQLEQTKSQQAQAAASLKLASINVERDTPLAQAHAIAQSQLDNDVQTMKQQEASVAATTASIQAAMATVEQAQLNLNFTKVRSLVDGIAGIAATQIGNLVSQTTVLTTVSQVNPIKAYFPISEQEYLQVAQRIKPGANGDWLAHSSAVPLRLTLSDNEIYPNAGRIVFADRQVDSQTGTIRIVGTFPNPGNILRPGQFGRVRAQTGVQRGALLIPQRAVSELQGKYQVAVVGSDNKIQIRPVSVGVRQGESWVITSGLKEGERVVSEGVGKVREGSPVVPKPDDHKSAGA